MVAVSDCVFCGIVAGTQPATVIREWPDGVAFVPLNPVCEGHALVIPRIHVADAITRPAITIETMRNAIELASDYAESNILTSIGRAATQSVFHLHIHVVPRSPGDQLMLPWGTTVDPHRPHRCKGMDALAENVRQLTASVATGTPLDITWHHQPESPVRYVPVPLEGPIHVRWRQS